MTIDLNRLKIFSYVYSNKSVSRAARQLNLSQPAVSQHLKKLEHELRIPLFTRANRKIVPTPAARRLYDRMNPLLAELGEEIKYLRRPLDMPYGLLRIGAPEIFSGNLLTSIFNKFRYRFPTVTFSLRCDNSENLLSSLAQGSVDLALLELTPEAGTTEPVNPLYYATQTLLDQPVVMVCSKLYFNRNISGKIDFERLMQCEYLRTNNGSRVIDQWFQCHYKRLPHDLRYVLTTDNHQSCLDAVRNGMGLGIFPYHLVSREVTAGTLSVIDSSGNQMISRLLLVQLKQKVPGLTEQAFVTVFKKELASLTRENNPRPKNRA